jgi:hypothetical protein
MTAANLKTDLVVIGGGGAGLAAAIAAAENGCARIIVLEKAGSAAGSTAMAHDVFGAESPVQKRQGIDAPKDELFAKDRRYLLPLRTPPYYAVKAHIGLCDTYGGIKINENMEALDAANDPIPGLFAAGTTAGCWESESYCYRLTGHLVGFALNSGRIAGENAAKYLGVRSQKKHQRRNGKIGEGAMIRMIAIIAMLFSASFWHASTAVAASMGCTRVELQSVVDRYVQAVKQGNPAIMPLAAHARYVENKTETAMGQGIWQTALDIDFHRSILDVDACETFTEAIHTANTHPYVIGTRLRVVAGKVEEIVSLVTDKDDWLFNADNYRMYSSKEKWDIIPADKRSDRQTLIAAAAAYFDIFSNKNSKVPWGIPCARLEGGIYTSKDFNDPKASCNVGVPEDGNVKLTNRHYVVDRDMGAVVGFVDFNNEKVPDSHLFRVENGKLRYIHTLTVCLIENCGFPRLDPKLLPKQ